MKNVESMMKKSPLCAGMMEEDIVSVMKCLNAAVMRYKKEEFIYRTGDRVTSLGLVLKGRVYIAKEDFWGNRNILSEVGEGGIFAETYACLGTAELGVDVIAAKDTEIVFLDIHKAVAGCGSACEFHKLLIHNLLQVMAGKNLMLTTKIGHIVQRSTREKLLSYLLEQSRRAHNAEFEIPFNRQQLADYLSVDRSAMSGELGKLAKEKVIEYHKNHFKLFKPQL